jgi:activating signal cointegrator complex subunit 3
MQSMIRIVGLSATLPTYLEVCYLKFHVCYMKLHITDTMKFTFQVAQFLRVNPDTGLFFFDSSYRPVPLAQQYIGISERDYAKKIELFNTLCYEKVVESIKQGHQALVFVHTRKDTGKTARTLIDLAANAGELELFSCADHPQYALIKKDVSKAKSREVAEFFESGFGIHNAGMIRSDRSLMERLFADGLLKVLVCTATLAWGVNLPAHTVVIKVSICFLGPKQTCDGNTQFPGIYYDYFCDCIGKL